MIRILLAVCLLTISSAPSYAEKIQKTTKALLSECSDASENDPISQFKQIHCLGYLDGVLDTVSMMLPHWPESYRFCPPPEGIDLETYLKIINEYVTTNPDTLNESARSIVFVAYAKAFPCNQ